MISIKAALCRLRFTYFVSVLCVLICSCHSYESLAPDYEDVNRYLSPEGKTVSGPGWILTAPEGAVGFPLFIPNPILNAPSEKGVNVPYGIFNKDDKKLDYQAHVQFQPLHTSFNKPVTVVFTQTIIQDEFAWYELIPGKNPALAKSWVDVTDKFTYTMGEFSDYTFTYTTDRFEPLLLTTPSIMENLYVNNSINLSLPSGWKKPTKMENGPYYSYMIGDYMGKKFIVYVYFVNSPLSGKKYLLKNSYQSSGFGNSNDAYCEIAAGFDCTVQNGAIANCGKEIFMGVSGEVKYTTEMQSNGVLKYYFLFKNCVIKLSESEPPLELNGTFFFF